MILILMTVVLVMVLMMIWLVAMIMLKMTMMLMTTSIMMMLTIVIMIMMLMVMLSRGWHSWSAWMKRYPVHKGHKGVKLSLVGKMSRWHPRHLFPISSHFDVKATMKLNIPPRKLWYLEIAFDMILASAFYRMKLTQKCLFALNISVAQTWVIAFEHRVIAKHKHRVGHGRKRYTHSSNTKKMQLEYRPKVV